MTMRHSVENCGKILCHNVCSLIQSMCELRIEPEFWTEPAKAIQDELRGEAGDETRVEPESGQDDLVAWDFV